ncbi:MAG: hypothetical protein RBQ97_01830 [Acholeplasma sp.]|nr:hypothetical protein [Acholeplasma sp.]
MKKILSIITLFIVAIGLVGCKKDDPAQAKLDEVYGSVGMLISDPSNVITGFTVKNKFKHNVAAEWSSSEPGIVSIGDANDNGDIIVTVNRPAAGSDDASVVLTAKLTLKAENSDKILEKIFTVTLTVKAETVAVEINNVADILNLKENKYDPSKEADKISVTLKDMTIFAAGDAAFAYDGTGIIQIYGASNFKVGKVYTVSGLLEWYYGIWEIIKPTLTEQEGATPKIPTKKTIESVTTEINTLAEAKVHEPSFGAAKDGNFEPIYATVTGKVYVKSADKYDTFLIDTELDKKDFKAGSSKETDGVTTYTPATGLMIYYGSDNVNLLKLYNGIEVTVDIVIYTYRSNNHAFAFYYVGGEEGIQANLTDAQKQSIDLGAIELPSYVEEASTLTLPATGKFGTTFTWASSNDDVINATTGKVTIPEDKAQTIELTVTGKFDGIADATRTIEVIVGEQEVITMENFNKLAKGATGYSEVEILALSTNKKTAVVGDATGYGYIYNGDAMDVKAGQFIGINYTTDVYNGLVQMKDVKIKEAKGEDPDLKPTAVAWTATEATTFANSKSWAPTYVTMTLVGVASGNYTNGYLKDYAASFVQTNGLEEKYRDKEFTVTGWVTGNSKGKITIGLALTAKDEKDLTDAQKLVYAASVLNVPAENDELKENLTLPTSGIFGAEVTWTSDTEAVIGNDGKVTRPENGAGDATVKLSYVVKVGDESTTAVELTFVVKALTESSKTVLRESDFGETNNSNSDYTKLYTGVDIEHGVNDSTPDGKSKWSTLGINTNGSNWNYVKFGSKKITESTKDNNYVETEFKLTGVTEVVVALTAVVANTKIYLLTSTDGTTWTDAANVDAVVGYNSITVTTTGEVFFKIAIVTTSPIDTNNNGWIATMTTIKFLG